MLFSFWDKKSTLTSTYLYDSIRDMKLYPVKSNNLVTTSVNTQLHVPKELVDYTLGFELSEDVYFNSATWDYSRYNWMCGRGNNTGFPSGMVAPGSIGNYFQCNWKNGGLSAVSMESKPAGWYRVTMIVTPTTHQQKVQNLSTGEIFLGTAELNGTSTIGESVVFTLFSYGIDGVTGAYGSVGMNVSNVKITRNGATIFHLPLSEGHLAVVRDVVSKTAYTLGFFTISAGWAKLADFSHYNFKNGFTLYKKDANPDIYVPNDSTGAEIHWTPTLSYVRIANYKGTTTSYNQCESKFKLDDVSAGVEQIVAVFNQAFWGGIFPETVVFVQTGEKEYQSGDGDLIKWFSTVWVCRSHIYPSINQSYSYTEDLETVLSAWTGVNQSFELQTGEASDLYNADPNHVLFTEGTGVAKEFEIGSMYSEIVDSVHDRGHLYINSDSDKNFMLYKTDKGVDTPADLKVWKYVNKE